MVAGIVKGFTSGRHYEYEKEDESGGGDGKKPSIEPVREYLHRTGAANELLPMFEIGYEEWNRAKGRVVSVRIWRYIYDSKHSRPS